MRHPEGSRFNRRLKAREELRRQLADHAELKHPLGDPRIDNDRRRVERRSTTMSPDEVNDWMKRNGILGGDRRKAQRRQGDRRR